MPEEDELDPYSTALFLDFDGTLVDIADRPDAVILRADIRDALDLLHDALDGALAVVSGRPVSELDSFLAPLRLPVAGVHGLEVRHGDADVQRHGFDSAALDRLVASARAFAANHPALLVETKAGSVAIHYRQAPELAEIVKSFADGCALAEPGVEILHGKMVAELRLGGRNKADAVSHFMERPPFVGRTPWFFGDDVTDEDGFRRVNDLGGRSVRIGRGPTAARDSFESIDIFHRWLVQAAGRAAQAKTTEEDEVKGGNQARGTRPGIRPASSMGNVT
ncbi:MAG: trehalose-phosphatase [Mesorhizobium sp.]|nr:trehalose-phosphatase [Mesorhizobium sp.]